MADRQAKIYVLDSTVFLEGYVSLFANKPSATTFQVVEEIRSGQPKLQLEAALRSGWLAQTQPSAESVKKVAGLRGQTQEKLSTADLSVIALAIDLKDKGKAVVVVSDDYHVQNLCKIIGIEYLAVSKGGIEKKFSWRRKCRGCGRLVREEVCPFCGSETVFVPGEI